MRNSAYVLPGIRIVSAPLSSDPRLRPTILDVTCGLDEEIAWHWTTTDRGRFVSGYAVTRRIEHPDALDAKTLEPDSRRKRRSRKIGNDARD